MFEEFYKSYCTQEKEYLILRADGSDGGVYEGCGSHAYDPSWDFWVGKASFLAYIDVASGKLFSIEGKLCWPVTNEEQKQGKCFGKYRHNTIYRVKARSLIDPSASKVKKISIPNNFYVTEILEEDVHSTELEEILTEYQKPVFIDDDVLGRLELDKDIEFFSGEIQWNGKEVLIDLEVDKDSKASWTRARNATKKLVENQKELDQEMRIFAAKELLEEINSYPSENGAPKNKMTEQEFVKRISLQSLCVDASGRFDAIFDNDGMFSEHAIFVRGSVKKGLLSASIK